MCANYHGQRGVVYMSTSQSGAATTVLDLTEWSLEATRDMAEVTSFGDTNKTYVSGLPDCGGSFSGFWDSASETLFDAADSADGCRMYLYPASNAPTIYWYGLAWVDASITVPVGDAVSISANWKANGNWTRFWA